MPLYLLRFPISYCTNSFPKRLKVFNGASAGYRTRVVYLAQPLPESRCLISWTDLGLNFHLCVLQITAYNRRTFETARHNLVINIKAAEGKRNLYIRA